MPTSKPEKKEPKKPLSVTHPELAKEALGWDPSTVTAGSTKKRSWKCKYNHIFEAIIGKRTSKNANCPICSGRKLLKGFNDLATTHPQIAAEAFGWDPTEVYRSYRWKVEWKCTLGHIYSASIESRTHMSSGCSFCGGKRVLAGFNDLESKFPEIAKEADGWDPKTITARSNRKVAWKCREGHQFSAGVDHRTNAENGTNCPICVNQKILKGYNDLETRFPEIASECFDWDPSGIGAGHKKKLNWKCKNGHIYKASPESRTQKHSGCPVCAGLQVLAGFNDLATTHPLIASEAEGWDPTKVIAGTAKKFKWNCNNGHIFTSSVNHRAERGQGCPSCTKYGFDPNKVAFLYLINHPEWQMLQIGITNVPDIRLPIHHRNGWNTVETRGPIDGLLARSWETAILRMLKKKGADLSNKKIAGKFDGYSEAWTKATFPVDSIKELMRLTDEFEENLGKGRRVE
jgi:hypothetical protein